MADLLFADIGLGLAGSRGCGSLPDIYFSFWHIDHFSVLQFRPVCDELMAVARTQHHPEADPAGINKPPEGANKIT